MFHNQRHRRAFLKDLGSLASLPWTAQLSSLLMSSQSALAQSTQRELNLILVSFPHGLISGNWEPQRLANGRMSLANSPVLAPLERFSDRVAVVTGLGFENLKPDGSLQPKFGHGGLASCFTGAAQAEDQGGGPSLDYLLSEKIYGPGNDQVLRLGGFLSYNPEGGLDSNTKSRICYAGSQDIHKLNVLAKPQDAFDKAFANFVPAASTGAVDPQKIQRERLKRLLLRPLERMEQRLSAQEKAQTRIYQQTLNSAFQSMARFTCESKPAQPGTAFGARNQDVAALIRAQMDVAVAALSCGASRLVSLEMMAHSHGSYNMKQVIDSDPLSTAFGAVSERLNTNNFHNDIAHNVGISGSDSATLNREILTAFHQSQRFFMVQLAYLMQSLSSAGQLDKTLVVVGTEMGSPMHLGDSAPFLLMGGGFPMGRWYDYPTERVSDYQHRCAPHNRLLVSIAQRFGLMTDSIGDSRFRGALGADKLMQGLTAV